MSRRELDYAGWERRRDANYRELAKGRRRCPHDNHLVSLKTGRCWACGRSVDPSKNDQGRLL